MILYEHYDLFWIFTQYAWPAIHLSGTRSTQARNPRIFITAFVLAVWYTILIPIWLNINTYILGDPETDAIRGMWASITWDAHCSSPNPDMVKPDFSCWSDVRLCHGRQVFFLHQLEWYLVHLSPESGATDAGSWDEHSMDGKTLTKSWPAGLLIGLSWSLNRCCCMQLEMELGAYCAWTVPLFLGSAGKELQPPTKWSLFAGFFAVLIALDPLPCHLYSRSLYFCSPFCLFSSMVTQTETRTFMESYNLVDDTGTGSSNSACSLSSFSIKVLQEQTKSALKWTPPMSKGNTIHSRLRSW